MSFWSELKRRNVYKVAVAYAIVAWLILQVASITFPALNLPTWALTLLTVFIIVCFPLVLIFAWAFEITPEGLKLTKDVPKDESITHLTGQKLNYILIGVIVLGVVYILFDNFYLDKLAIQTEVESRVAELAPPAVDVKEATKTIAVLPFDDYSPDNNQGYFVLGLSEEILNTLANIPDLLVTAKTSSFAFEGENKTVQEIGPILGVANILEGSVRKAGDKLRVTAQLIRAADGFHLWSDQYDRDLKETEDIISIQEDIAKAVANELKVTLGLGESFKQLGGTDSLEAYELYLNVKGLSYPFYDGPNLYSALEKIDTAIALDPGFALAWAEKANIHDMLSAFLPADLASSELDDSLTASLKAIELEPNLSEAYASRGNYRMMRGELIEAELDYRKAYDLSTEPSGLLEGYSHLLFSTGYFDKLKNLSDSARAKDPLNIGTRSIYISSLFFLGDEKGGEKEYERCEKLFGDGWEPVLEISKRLGYGELVPSEDLSNEAILGDDARIDLESKEKGLAELHRLYIENENKDSRSLPFIVLLAANLGDHELAMDALEKIASRNTGAIHFTWFPVMNEVRQLQRFKKLIREIGLVDYWNEFGWPDICHPTGDGDFVCD